MHIGLTMLGVLKYIQLTHQCPGLVPLSMTLLLEIYKKKKKITNPYVLIKLQ